MRHNKRRFKCFKGEFFYHKDNWKKYHDCDYIDEKNNISEYIFESNDIWIIWSLIKSNLDYKLEKKYF